MRNILLTLATLSYAFGQQPVIRAITNAASGVSSAVAPQMLISIYGANLAGRTTQADNFPLPVQLAGTSVTFNGFPAPLLYVSPTQLNAQVPTGVQGSPEANAVVTTPSGASAEFAVGVSSGRVLGVFTQDASGCGQAAVLNIHADGSMSVNTPLNSFDPQADEGLAFFVTGMGAFEDRADGRAWQVNPVDDVRQQIGMTYGEIPGPAVISLGAPYFGISYAGPAPGLAGVEQVNAFYSPQSPVVFPPLIPPLETCRMPVAIFSSGAADRPSQYVNVSVHSGGGACVEPPADSLGVINWQQHVTSESGGTLSSSSVAVHFLEAPRIFFPPPPVVSVVGAVENYGFPPSLLRPTACNPSYPSALTAGELTARGPGFGPISLHIQHQSGLAGHEAVLPRNRIEGGEYSVDATGAGALARFSASANIPAPIDITTDLRPGAIIGLPLTVNWTGGDRNSSVTVRMKITVPGKPNPYEIFVTSLASDGGRTLFPPPPEAKFTLPPQADVEIIVTEQSVTIPSQPFTAEGLTLGGEQTWSYVFDFKGLKTP